MTYTPTNGYKSSKFYTQLTAVELTNDQRMNLVRVAESQIGYHEGSDFTQYDGMSSGSLNVTEYDYWIYRKDVKGDTDAYAWCTFFVQWCAEQAGFSDLIPQFGGCTNGWNNVLPKCDGSLYRAGSYTPQPGDLIFFYKGASTSPHHVGIV